MANESDVHALQYSYNCSTTIKYCCFETIHAAMTINLDKLTLYGVFLLEMNNTLFGSMVYVRLICLLNTFYLTIFYAVSNKTYPFGQKVLTFHTSE